MSTLHNWQYKTCAHTSLDQTEHLKTLFLQQQDHFTKRQGCLISWAFCGMRDIVEAGAAGPASGSRRR